MEEFDCNCKSVDCRKHVTGTDFLKPFMEKYRDHVSNFVALKIKEKDKNV